MRRARRLGVARGRALRFPVALCSSASLQYSIAVSDVRRRRVREMRAEALRSEEQRSDHQ